MDATVSNPPVTDRPSVDLVHLEPCASLQSIDLRSFREREKDRTKGPSPEPVISSEFILIVYVNHAQRLILALFSDFRMIGTYGARYGQNVDFVANSLTRTSSPKSPTLRPERERVRGGAPNIESLRPS